MSHLSLSRLSLALGLGGLCASACSSENGSLFAPLPDSFAAIEAGRASFAIEANGLALSSASYVVTRGDIELRRGDAAPPASGAAIEFTLDLPAGEGYAVAMKAHTDAGLECSGVSARFDIGPGQVVDVAIALVCERDPAPAQHGQAHVSAELMLEPPAAGACDGLGRGCHAVDGGSASLHECHELGHAGDAAACAERRAPCIDLCGAAQCAALSSLCHEVDPGSGPLHECHQLGHAGDAAACFARGAECQELCAAAHSQPLTIRFEARIGDAAFACGQSYAGVGAPPASVSPHDFRFFVHDVALIAADGARVPVDLDTRAPFQALGVALLDFEDGSGGCVSGDAAINAEITGRAPPGDYTGIAFVVGVPARANHGDPALQPAPLGAGGMSWGWLSGYKFLRAELGSDAGATPLHLGSVGCSGDPAQSSVSCMRPNRPEILLEDFSPASDRVIADLGALFAGSDLTDPGMCHSSGTRCAPMFERLGLDVTTGQSTGAQSVFRVAR
jgi:uncharacterized repeat protein (TIGR04052 family)